MKLIRQVIVLAFFIAADAWVTRAAAARGDDTLLRVAGDLLTIGAAVAFVMVCDSVLRVFFWHGYVGRVFGVRVPRLLPLTTTIIVGVLTSFHVLQNQFGVSVAGALAASGFIAVILGFALRSVILDLFSGLAVSIDRSYAVGDWITVTSRDFDEPVYGKVEEIDWRTTRLQLEDGTRFVMPNSFGGSLSITNHSQPAGAKRLEIEVRLPPETHRLRAERMLLGAAEKTVGLPGFSPSPAPRILIREIGAKGVVYLVRFWTHIDQISPTTARSEMLKAAIDAVTGSSITFPGERVDVLRRERDEARHAARSLSTKDALARVALFAEVLTDSELSRLASRVQPRHMEKGLAFIRQGEEGDSFFLLVNGAARVTYENGAETAHTLATLSTGDLVGERSLLTGERRSATVTAITALDAIEIRKDDLAPILHDRPQIAQTLSELLTRRDEEQAALEASQLTETAPSAPNNRDLLGRIREAFGL